MKTLLLIAPHSVHSTTFIKLVESNFSNIILVSNKKVDLELEHQEIVDFSLNLKNLFKIPSTLKALYAKYKPSHIHVHQANSYAFYSALAFGENKKMVLTVWGSDIFLLPKKNFLMHWMVRFSVNRFSHFTACSSTLADALKDLLKDKSKYAVVANFGIEPVSCFAEKEKIFYTNRLHKPLYRITDILKAFQLFKNNDSDGWRLVIAGEGSETESLKELTNRLGLDADVEFVGWLDRQTNEQWYARATYWISIPESDATSISLMEAMAYGCIPVVSDLPANKEVIENGVNGIVVDKVDYPFLNNLELDHALARAKNAEIVEQRATKTANRKLFCTIYDKAEE